MSASLIDLHTHTTHSDGSDTPEELIEAASLNGASAVAITDHDTVSGFSEARAAAARCGIEFVPGIEISAEYESGTMHVLGYCVDEASPGFQEKLDELKQARQERNPRIARRLQSLGIEIDYDEVARLAGNEVVGRPHFARLMVEKGYVANIQEAFDRFLKKGASAYVEKARLSPADAIALIHRAKGVAVLAHPYQLRLSSAEQADDLLTKLKELGLDGIEAIYSRHSPAERALYTELARHHQLLITGGSDYHGSYKPDISIVRGLGNLEVPYELLAAIKVRANKPADFVPVSEDGLVLHAAERDLR
jgi:predicted metal-dependent phosphoesterase TrpH